MKTVVRAIAVVFLLAALPAVAADSNASVKVINSSSWDIHHIYFSSTDDPQWGEDQLEDSILGKGDSLTLTGIPCDTYDIKVVDEDGDECVIEEVELCGDDSYWKITDDALLECEGY